MSRRGENIYKRKDGRWEARYPKKHSIDGHMIYGSVYGKTYTEAKTKRTQKIAECQSATDMICVPTGWHMTLRELSYAWLAYKRESVKEATYVRYRHLYERHIDAEFGNCPISNLDYAEVEAYIRSKQKGHTHQGLSGKTIQDIISVYRLIIRYGTQQGYLEESLLRNIRPSSDWRRGDNRVSVFLPQERVMLEQYVLTQDNVRCFGILLAMYTGLRIGELCALKWEDIDLHNQVIYVRHTLQRLHDYSAAAQEKTKIMMSVPKTQSSLRVIPLSAFLLDRLMFFSSLPHHYLLTDSDKPEEPRAYLYFYKRQLHICGLPEYTFHTIRHTFATRCVEEGVDIKSLSEILGHSNVQITMNRYVHPSLEMKRRQLERLSCAQ